MTLLHYCRPGLEQQHLQLLSGCAKDGNILDV